MERMECGGHVRGTPGLRTLRNLLATAMEPMGSTLYVYGGGWDLEDTGAGPEARRIGPSPCWESFFRRQDARYAYRDDRDPENGFYPRSGQNRFHWAGLDCSGYLGWTVYNTLHAEDGGPGYVRPAVEMAGAFAARGWGDCVRRPEGPFLPGDVCSIAGHVWLCVGTCGDGSAVLAHSTPSPSRCGCPGGGVQLSAIDPADRDGCEAYRLALAYMVRFPAWSLRYAPVRKDWARYTDFSRGGRFRWALDGSGPLTDPDGISHLDAAAMLRALPSPCSQTF